MAGFAFNLFKALAALPTLISKVEEFAAGVVLWYVSRENNTTAKEIADAASFAARAKTKEDRVEALRLWSRALSRSRIIK